MNTFLHLHANDVPRQGLIHNSSIHVGIRAPVLRPQGDIRNDIRCGFEIVTARDLDRLGVDGIVQKIKSRVGDTRVYITVDIDVLDPAYAPGRFTILHKLTPLYLSTRTLT